MFLVLFHGYTLLLLIAFSALMPHRKDTSDSAWICIDLHQVSKNDFVSCAYNWFRLCCFAFVALYTIFIAFIF